MTGMSDDSKPNCETKTSAPDTVLIAEDDPIFRRILESWLRRWDYRVSAMDNGLDAWNALQKEDAPQMVILDWMMPRMDGLELCRKIRSLGQRPYRYVLLLTAKDDKQDVVAGLDAGADDYLTKPFDVEELRARVRAGKRILELQQALIRAHGALEFEAAHDRLTTLWNRGAIVDALKREVQRSLRTEVPLGIVMADIDHFKKVNDSQGHLAGDAVLQEVARRLAAAVRSYDLVGRYGGEEFLIILPGCDAPDLGVTAERLRRCVADQPIHQLSVSISLGVASFWQSGDGFSDCEALLRAADTALYQAKAQGRNRIVTAPAVQTPVL